MKSPLGLAFLPRTMVLLGHNQFPTGPLPRVSAFLQHIVLTWLVLHTRDGPGSVELVVLPGRKLSPTSVMGMVAPGRYTVPLNVKYSPVLGGSREI